MKALIVYTYEEKDILWTKLSYQHNDCALDVSLKHPYTPIELAAALRFLSDKIRMKASFK